MKNNSYKLNFSEYFNNNINVSTPAYINVVSKDNNAGECSSGAGSASCTFSQLTDGAKTETGSIIKIGTDNMSFTCTGGNNTCCNTVLPNEVQVLIKDTDGSYHCSAGGDNVGHKCKDDYTYTTCYMSDVPDCLPGKAPANLGDFCRDCGKNNACSGNGTCILGACRCNDGYFGVHCENKNCKLVPSGTCTAYTDNCNKSVPGCTYSPHNYEVSTRTGILQLCDCNPDYNPDLTEAWSVYCPDWQGNPRFKPKDMNYWNSNKDNWGDGNKTCESNFGNGSYQVGPWHDCGKHGGQNYTSSILCKAPAGSKNNVPWYWYEENL